MIQPPPGEPGHGPPPQEQPYGPPPHPMPGYGAHPQEQPTQSFTSPSGAPPVGQTPPSQPKPKRRWPWVVAGVVVAFGVGAAAGGGNDEAPEAEAAASSAAATTTVVVTRPAPVVPSTAPAPTPPPAPVPVPATPTTSAQAAPVVDFSMPNLVGVDLQTAQDTVQLNGVLVSVSHDLLGTRAQVMDSNWIVCTQNFAPGERVTGEVEGAIDFGVVKRGEGCP